MNRRILRMVTTGGFKNHRYAYDGWNEVEELGVVFDGVWKAKAQKAWRELEEEPPPWRELMIRGEMFDSSVRAAGDLAGVFEYDGETGYFYLYETGREEGHKVLGSIHVISGEPDFSEEDVAIEWDAANRRVGLFIRDMLWAVFDEGRMPLGGSYRPGATPQLPSDARTWFGTPS